jgi:magnesium transporter
MVPGSLEHIGERKEENVRLTVIEYDGSRSEQIQVETVAEAAEYKDRPSVTWLNIDGLHDTEVVRAVGDVFGVHPLVLEDVLNTQQRPKAEFYDHYVSIILRMLYVDPTDGKLSSEQVSLILGEGFVISFQERAGDVFDPVRERIFGDKGRIRRAGADYLAYALVDAIVDGYFVILEHLGERIEELEESLVIRQDDSASPAVIHGLKTEMIGIRRAIWPLREAISSIERTDAKLFVKDTRLYVRDLYDHTIQVIDAVESYRDLVTGLMDLYMSSVSNGMNKVMKVLTIIATIFIPLTFIAGIYGMNFNPEVSPWNMPELDWRFGYPAALLLMTIVAVGMVFYFRRKKWL